MKRTNTRLGRSSCNGPVGGGRWNHLSSLYGQLQWIRDRGWGLCRGPQPGPIKSHANHPVGAKRWRCSKPHCTKASSASCKEAVSNLEKFHCLNLLISHLCFFFPKRSDELMLLCIKGICVLCKCFRIIKCHRQHGGITSKVGLKFKGVCMFQIGNRRGVTREADRQSRN